MNDPYKNKIFIIFVFQNAQKNHAQNENMYTLYIPNVNKQTKRLYIRSRGSWSICL